MLTKLFVAKRDNSQAGFTLLELLVVIGLVAVLSTIAGVSWLVFVNNQRLGTANDAIGRAMREAQSQAEARKLTWQASFRENGNTVQWAVHQYQNSIDPDSLAWEDLETGIGIEESISSLEYADFNSDSTLDGYRAVFNPFGEYQDLTDPPVALPHTITLSHSSGTQTRCTSIQTLLGAMISGSGDDTSCS